MDAETKALLDGVFVLAVWYRRAEHMQLGYGQTGFSTLAEAVTDADGRFTIPARLLLNPPLPFPIKGPELAFVRAGYGGWRLVGPESTLTGGGAVIELRPLPTRAARVAYLQGRTPRADRESPGWRDAERPANPDEVPYARLARYAGAINAARAAVGLGPVAGRWPGAWGTAFQFASRADIGVDPDGHVFSITGRWEAHEPQVRTYDRRGTLLAAWGNRGSAPGQLFDPSALAVDAAGRLYVADASSAGVLVFAPDGRFLHQWDRQTAPSLRFPKGLAIDRQGVVYVADGPRLQRLGPLRGR